MNNIHSFMFFRGLVAALLSIGHFNVTYGTNMCSRQQVIFILIHSLVKWSTQGFSNLSWVVYIATLSISSVQPPVIGKNLMLETKVTGRFFLTCVEYLCYYSCMPTAATANLPLAMCSWAGFWANFTSEKVHVCVCYTFIIPQGPEGGLL